jgi:hypothetical protein
MLVAGVGGTFLALVYLGNVAYDILGQAFHFYFYFFLTPYQLPSICCYICRLPPVISASNSNAASSMHMLQTGCKCMLRAIELVGAGAARISGASVYLLY